MGAIPKEVIQEIVKGNNFQNPGEVLAFLKDALKDVLQEMLETEMDVKLGYSRDDITKKNTENSRNGYTPKTVRSELGPVQLDIPRDRKGEFEPKIVPKYKRMFRALRRKSFLFMPGVCQPGTFTTRLRTCMALRFLQKWSAR